jgi:hypothetical protein
VARADSFGGWLLTARRTWFSTRVVVGFAVATIGVSSLVSAWRIPTYDWVCSLPSGGAACDCYKDTGAIPGSSNPNSAGRNVRHVSTRPDAEAFRTRALTAAAAGAFALIAWAAIIVREIAIQAPSRPGPPLWLLALLGVCLLLAAAGTVLPELGQGPCEDLN